MSTNHLAAKLGFNYYAIGFLVVLFVLNCPVLHAQNNALIFDGTNEHLTVPHDPTLNVSVSDFTLEAWVYPTNTGSLTILAKGHGGGVNNSEVFIFAVDVQKIKLYLHGTTSGAWGESLTTVPLNTWSHVAVSYDINANQATFYLNGAADGTFNYPEPPSVTDTNPLFIAQQGYSCACNHFNGQLDEIRIWNKQRNAEEIANNHDRPVAGDVPGLVAYYDFEANVGTSTAVDATLNGHDATLINMEVGADWVTSGPVLQSVNKSAVFSGSNTYFLAPTAGGLPLYSSATADFTVEMWIKGGPQAFNYVYMEANSGSSTVPHSWISTTAGGQLLFAKRGDGVVSAYGLTSNAIILDNTWHHIAWVDNASSGSPNVKVYVDGQLDVSQNYSLLSYTGVLDEVTIGAFNREGEPSSFFVGEVDEMRLWTGVRTAQEIALNTKAEFTAAPNLEAYYDFNEDSGNATDRTVNGNNATNMGVAFTPTTSNESDLPPITPSNFIAYAVSESDVTIEWNDQSNDEIGFVIQQATDEAFSAPNYISVGPNSISHTISTGPGQSFYYRIASRTQNDTSAYSELGHATTFEFPSKALRFDTSSSTRITASTNLPGGSSPFTLEFWIKREGQSGDRWITWWGHETPVADQVVLVGFDGTTGRIKLHRLSGNDVTATTATIPVGTYTHVGLVYNGSSTTDIYIDGSFVETVDNTVAVNTPPNPYLEIGTFDGQSAYTLQADLDEFRIWDYAKTDFSDRFSFLNGNEAGLILVYYPFEEGAGFTAVDNSTNDNTGVINGGVYVPSTLYSPVAPDSLYVYEVTEGHLQINWADQSQGEEGHKILASSNASGPWSEIATGIQDTFFVHNLAADTSLYYRVAAYTGAESDTSYVKFGSTLDFPGNTLQLDGVDDFFGLSGGASLLSGKSVWTFEAWLKLATPLVKTHGIMSDPSAAPTIITVTSTGVIQIRDATNTGNFQSTAAAYPDDGQWHHIAISNNGNNTGQGAIYIDGTPVSLGSNGFTSWAASSDSLVFGKWDNSASEFLDGEIDEIRFWDISRSQTDIQNTMNNNLNGNENGLLFYYPLDENSGNAVFDASLNTNNAESFGPTRSSSNLGAPVAPDSLYTTQTSPYSVQLNWRDQSATEDGFKVLASSTYNGIWTEIATVTDTFFVHNVGQDTSVFYRVAAYKGSAADTSEVDLGSTYNFPGRSLNFNGLSTLVSAPETLGYTSSFTISAWIKPGNFIQNQWIFFRGNPASNDGIELYINTSGNLFYGESDGTYESVISAETLPLNKWTHVAATRTGTTMQLYINGVASGTSNTVTGTPPGGQFTIGARDRLSGTDGYFMGPIDEMTIWDVAHTDFSFSNGSVPPNDTNLMAYYSFDEDTGDKVIDRTQNGNNGTISGAIIWDASFMPSVTNTKNEGSGSLRAAIEAANFNVGRDSIIFDLPGAGPWEVLLNSPLPIIDELVIDATNQPGYNFSTGDLISLRDTTGTHSGIFFDSLGNASYSAIFGLRFEGFANGIAVTGDNNRHIQIGTVGKPNVFVNNNIGLLVHASDSLTIQANYIGLEYNEIAFGNDDGIVLENGSNGSLIGGTYSEGNIVSGNIDDAITLDGLGTSYNVISGNMVGTNVAGNTGMGNGGEGIYLKGGASYNKIGDDLAEIGNVIADNTGDGILIINGSDFNEIYANHIGIDASGLVAMPNSDGIDINDADYTIIGGSTFNLYNTVSGNTDDGIEVDGTSWGTYIVGNYVGLNAAGNALGNGQDGIKIENADYSTIGDTLNGARNYVGANGLNAILVKYASQTFIYNNFLGTDATGLVAAPNAQNGIKLFGADSTFIGTNHALGGNVISGNSDDGIDIDSSAYTFIKANIIGLDSLGDQALPNAFNGILAKNDASYFYVGDTIAGARNVISGNGSDGLAFSSSPYSGYIFGNYIGTDISGFQDRSNSGSGIDINGTSFIQIGATNPLARNIISGNNGGGIELSGSSATQNQIIQNYIGVDINGAGGSLTQPFGIHIFDRAYDNYIGSSNPTDANLIADNDSIGVIMEAAADSLGPNYLQINAIGCNVQGQLVFHEPSSGVVNGGIQPPIVNSITGATISGGTPGYPNGALVYVYEADSCSNSGGFTYVDQATVSSGSWSISGAFDPQKKYLVSGFVNGVGTSQYSGYLEVPDSVLAQVDDLFQAQLSWGSVSGASQYVIERSVNDTLSFGYLGTTANTFYTDATVDDGNLYFYRVFSDDGTSLSQPSATVMADIKGPGATINFNGIDQYVELTRTTLASGLTYMAWIYTTAYDSSDVYAGNPAYTIVGDHDNNIRTSFGVSNGHLEYNHWDGSWYKLSGGRILNDGEWHFVAVTHSNSGEVHMYVDGLVDAVGSKSYNASSSFDRIGGSYLNGTGTGAFFEGYLDDVRIHNAPLTHEEVKSEMYHTDIYRASLVRHYDFDMVSDTLLVDHRNRADGLLQNFTGNEWEYSDSYVPFALAATKVTANGFEANWLEVTNATEYIIEYADNDTLSSSSVVSLSAPALGAFINDPGAFDNISPLTPYYYQISFKDGNYISEPSQLRQFMVEPGNALIFDATDDLLDFEGPVQYEIQDFTIEFWALIEPTATRTIDFFKQYDPYGGGQPKIVSASTNTQRPYIFIRETTSGTSGLLTGNTVIFDSLWHHIAYVRAGNTLSIYVDGQLDNSTTIGFSGPIQFPVETYTEIAIEGAMDEFRFWDHAKPQEEIEQLQFTSLTGGETGLRAYLKMDEDDDFYLMDQSTYYNDVYWSGAAGDFASPNWAISDTYSNESFAVTNTNDSGAGSLRQAIIDANGSSADFVEIIFNLPGTDTTSWVIAPLSPLPQVTAPVIINGSSQPNWDFATGQMPIIDGSGFTGNGLEITSPFVDVFGLKIRNLSNYGIYYFGENADNARVGEPGRGNIFLNNDTDIYILNADSITIQANHFGVKADGVTAQASGDAIRMINTASYITIGGSNALDEGNIIAVGSGTGYSIHGSNTDHIFVQGNLIGIGADGVTDVTNARGVYFASSTNIFLGDSNDDLRNYIGGMNSQCGIYLSNVDSVLVTNNWIGFGLDSLTALGSQMSGIEIHNSSTRVHIDQNVISGNTVTSGAGILAATLTGDVTLTNNILGLSPNEQVAIPNRNGIAANNSNQLFIYDNIIAGNLQEGIYLHTLASDGAIIQGNIIGTNSLGSPGLGNGQFGIRLYSGAENHQIGGTLPGEENVISGNGSSGIHISATSNGNMIFGNIIGLAPNEIDTLANGQYGIYIGNSANNVIGGVGTDVGNTIALNTNAGVYIRDAGSTNNEIIGNSIFGNPVGIELAFSAHGNQEPPYILDVKDSLIIGRFPATASTGEEVHVYSNELYDVDQGKTYLGVFTATGGETEWTIAGAGFTSATSYQATLTTVNGTSEFSAHYIVDNDGDAGFGTLREAISVINGTRNGGSISFDMGAGPYTISPATQLPDLTNFIIIDATTEPSFDWSSGALVTLDGSGCAGCDGLYANNQDVTLELYGMRVTNFTNGVRSIGVLAEGHKIGAIGKGNILVNNSTYGLQLDGANNSNIRIQSNLVGIEWNDIPAGNGSGINARANGMLIGGPLDTLRNVISGNTNYGLFLQGADGSMVENNFIGTNTQGQDTVANGSDAIFIASGDAGIRFEGNVIGAGQHGMYFQSLNDNHIIRYNYIGLTADSVALPNAQNGIFFDGSNATNNLVSENMIAYNQGAGVLINDVGSIGNQITANAIFANVGGGIVGGNNNYASPLIDFVALDSVHGTAAIGDRIHLYLADTLGQGQVFLDSIDADGVGDWFISGLSLTGTDQLVATASDVTSGTSIFSLAQGPAPEMDVEVSGIPMPDSASFDLGAILMGDTKNESVIIYNNGSVDLNLSGTPLAVSSNPSEFTIDLTGTSTLVNPANQTSFAVAVTPSVPGNRVSEISIENDDSDENPYEVILHAFGYPNNGDAGTALDFDGVDDFISLNANALGDGYTGVFSVEVWVNVPNYSGFDATYGAAIIRNTNNDAVGDYFVSVLNDGTVGFMNNRTGGEDASGFRTTVETITPGIWQHIAVVWNGSSNEIYINGNLANLNADASSGASWSPAWEIGRTEVGPAYYFNGEIDELRVWSYPLTGTDINNYLFTNDLTGHPGIGGDDLMAYYRFDENEGQLLYDLSFDHHGQLLDDNGGNGDGDAVAIWTTSGALYLDTTPPTISINVIATDDIINGTEDDVDVSITGGTDAEDGQTVTVTLNAQTYTGTASSNTWSVLVPAVDVQALNTNETVYADVNDLAGNSAIQANRAITYDPIVPTITLDPIAVNDTINAAEDDSPVVVSGTTDAENGQIVNIAANAQNYTATVSGGVWSTGIPALDVQAFSGSEQVDVDVSDVAGNASAVSSRTVIYDPVAPSISVNTKTTNDSSPELDGSVDDPSATIDILVDGNNYQATNNGDGTWVLTAGQILSLADGTYEVVATATDKAGNSANDLTAGELIIDTSGPLVTINSSEPDPTNSSSFIVNIDFSESVSGFEVSDITVTNGSASNLTTGDSISFSVDIAPTADGLVSVDVGAGVATDGAGNGNTAASTYSNTYDNTPPTVDIQDEPAVVSSTSPYNVTFSFNENVSGFVIGDIMVGNGSASNLTKINDSTYTVDITPNGVGDITIDVASGVAQDIAGNLNVAAIQAITQYDASAPTVTISSSEPDPTNSSSFIVNIDFSESVSGFEVSEIAVSNGSASNLTTADSISFSVDIAPTADGLVSVDVGAGVATDGAGNGNTAASTYSNTYDNTPPTVDIQDEPAVVSSTSPFSITLQFSEDVSGFVVGDISVTNGSAGNFMAVDASTYTADITPSGTGDMTISINAGVAQDAAGNTNTAAFPAITQYDASVPTVTITSAEPDPTNSSSFIVNIDFSESVSGFELSDITVTNGSASNLTTGDSISFSVDIAPTADGLVSVDVGAGVATDGGGNGNTAATTYSIIYDNTAPTVDIQGEPAVVSSTSPFSITLQFSEDVSGFVVGDISVTNGSAGNFMAVDASTYTADITPSGTGDMTISINAGV
ncbi:LamG-like jellyroll fold domain-containing protein, partial [Marinoscillum furvescens]|uniref:LamG-like jellyroll fold domain-containing protein n=1 Tax=Marinoscillum furvescens TaxID=1026 RepID=UPI000E2715A3